MTTTAERLRYIMDLRSIKQSELIEKTKINKGALSSYLSGRYSPKQDNIYLLAKALDVNEAWLMGRDVPMERTASPAPAPAPVGSPQLREDERQLLSDYNLLDTEDRAEVRGYARGLAKSEKYSDASVAAIA